MPSFIACYDLEDITPSPYQAFWTAAEQKGWKRWIDGNSGKSYRLPNTTLTGDFPSEEAAIQALKDTHSRAQGAIGRMFKMPKWIVAPCSTATFNSDDTK